ncbi:hypothetical protein J2R78_001542 [Bradyrhizobium sp. USDA 4538]|nr:hypothetical protein [Bradyrhizobium sp. USDA 4538]MCP1899140.1 hypothetical protein [Bradyrhizobium sp. USDA 4537]MCP1986747.1 hypothetical protein [Bradyrhizobium sp. USDA 4539]
MIDAVLEARLFAKSGTSNQHGHRRLAEPDWAAVHRELKRKHMTLSILWEEYIAAEPGGYRRSRFCELYRAWEGRLSVTMRHRRRRGRASLAIRPRSSKPCSSSSAGCSVARAIAPSTASPRSTRRSASC